MVKATLIILITLFNLLFPISVTATNNSYLSIVNPIRGEDFWDQHGQFPQTAVLGQKGILRKYNLPTTWLVRYDALKDKEIIEALKDTKNDEKGLFLEVTPTWTNDAKVTYREGKNWHEAGSAFLTGYERKERDLLIDTAFNKFKETFGYFPKSVGAWWIDAYSLEYMQSKYDIRASLIVADQYTTDNYQIWGQYWATPYYPSKKNALHPASNKEDKLSIVVMQWAARDPVNAYGNGVEESTYSVQANDYIDYHDLNTSYFSKLVDIYTDQPLNSFGHLVVGLENSYSWVKYKTEYENQIKTLVEKNRKGQLAIITMEKFADWYRNNFPDFSPPHIIVADDPVNTTKRSVWFMNQFYRLGWFFNADGSVFRDIRQYIEGEEEICFKTRCDSVNFATSATRVLDDISFGDKVIIDQGKINNFKVEQKSGDYFITYHNEAGSLRKIGLLPRDISIDGDVFSIDSFILNALKKNDVELKAVKIDSTLKWSAFSVIVTVFKFITFLFLIVVIPGYLLVKGILDKPAILLTFFSSVIIGLVLLTLLFYTTSLVNLKQIIFIYPLISLLLLIKTAKISTVLESAASVLRGITGQFVIVLVILLGTIFQGIPVFRSGLQFNYGLGFWGPNTHDGLWHVALINKLTKSVPPENPIFSGETLKNYHYFYDILLASTNYLTGIPVVDLVFRFYPVIFSLMLGLGSYYLLTGLFQDRLGKTKTKLACFFSLFLIYFAGSFGWVVEYIKFKHFGGESAFWANQAVSFNLNPPFALSLIVIIALLLLLFNISHHSKKGIILAILIVGSLVGFKSYGAILILVSLLIVGLIKRVSTYLLIFIGGLLISLFIFLQNFQVTTSLMQFSPFWFIHSMIDSPDRVGWVRLTLAREVGLATGNWFKYISAEAISLLIFIAGNLGLRAFSLLSFFKIKTIIRDERFLFVFIFAMISFLIPLTVIQSGNPWNTIQFMYYGLYIAALTSGVFISALIFSLHRYLRVFVIIVIIIIGPVNSIVTASGYLSEKPHAFISSQEMEGLRFLSDQPDGVVLTYSYDDSIKKRLAEPWPTLIYGDTAYVSAFANKSVYIEDEPQNQILLTDYKKRVIASKDFFAKPTAESFKFLQENKIKYIYLPKIFAARLNENKEIMKILENDEVIIYKYAGN